MVVLQLKSKNALLERPQPKHIKSDWPQICRKQSEISLNWPKSHMQLYFTLCFCIFVPFCCWYFFWVNVFVLLCFVFMSTGLTVPYTETDTQSYPYVTLTLFLLKCHHSNLQPYTRSLLKQTEKEWASFLEIIDSPKSSPTLWWGTGKAE